MSFSGASTVAVTTTEQAGRAVPMKRHRRDDYYVVGEGILATDRDGRYSCRRPSTVAALRKFRFSRLGPQGTEVDEGLLAKLAEAMVAVEDQAESSDPEVPAGFTYLGQFVDHDLTMDRTARALGESVTVDELLQGRSPALDLDSVYGRGPGGAADGAFYAADGASLKLGRTAAVPFPDAATNVDLDGFDLPRTGFGSTKAERRAARMPDPRNDENLAVAQTHLAFLRFHNRVVTDLETAGLSGRPLFEAARDVVVRHYQWMLRTDLLPRIVDPATVDDVFTNGRRFFEVPAGTADDGYPHIQPGDTPTMPIEFSVAAYRLGHSMVRDAYQWNRVFRAGGPAGAASLELLFRFSGTSGTLSPDGDLDDPESGGFERLPTNWIADFTRLYDFVTETGRADLAPPEGDANLAKRVDTLLVDPLKNLPLGSFGPRGVTPAAIHRNLAFRNLVRANMVKLASGQQMADFLQVPALKPEDIVAGGGGAVLDGLDDAEKQALTTATPLWFYVLREAELNGGRLAGIGARITAEVFHRAMEGSRTSIVRDPQWRPTLGPDADTFRMTHLLLYACEGRAELLNPLGRDG